MRKSESPSGANDDDENPSSFNTEDLLNALQQINPNCSSKPILQGKKEIFNSLAMGDDSGNLEPIIEIIRQPVKTTRFRYECESRLHSSLPGRNSGPSNKTFPTIRVVGCKGLIGLQISCVTKDKDECNKYKTHPHKIVGMTSCKNGIYYRKFTVTAYEEIQLTNFTIQCTKKKEFEKALGEYKNLGIDPFKAGFDHKNHASTIDATAVRLCFQIHLLNNDGSINKILDPIVSDPIIGNRDLKICKVTPRCLPAAGGVNVVILCEKVPRNDLRIVFFNTKKDGTPGWKTYAPFRACDVHKQVAILFKAPEYENQTITESVEVFVQLERLSDGFTSKAYSLSYIPNEPIPDEPFSYIFEELRRKRKIYDNDPSLHELRKLQGIMEPVLPQENSLFNPLIESPMSPFVPGPSTSSATTSPSIYPEDTNSIPGKSSPETVLSASSPLHLQNRVTLSPHRRSSPNESPEKNSNLQYQHQEINQFEINIQFPDGSFQHQHGNPITFINQLAFHQHLDNQPQLLLPSIRYGNFISGLENFRPY